MTIKKIVLNLVESVVAKFSACPCTAVPLYNAVRVPRQLLTTVYYRVLLVVQLNLPGLAKKPVD